MISDSVLVGVTLLVSLVPGFALGWALGLRRAVAAGAAPALTFGLVASAATLASVVDLPWRPWSFALWTAAVCLVAVGVRTVVRRRRGAPTEVAEERSWLRRPSRGSVAVCIGVVMGWLLSAGTLYRGFGSTLGNPNQDWDYVFHSNALRLIADSGNVDPDALRAINDWEVQSSFYPNAFHALGALVRDLTGAPVFDVLNAATMMIAGIAGLGLAVLLRALRAPVAVAAITPVLLAGFASFPYDTIFRGPLLPYATGVALIPAFFLVLHESLRVRTWAAAVAGGFAAAALLGVQTSTALTAALAVVPYLVQRWASPVRHVLRDLRQLVVLGVSAVVLAVPFVAGALSMNSTGPRVDWPAVESVGQATGDLLMLNHASAAPQYWLAGLLLIGLLALHAARYLWWWAAAGAVSFALFIISAATDVQLGEDLTSPWWNDRWRFAAVVVLALAPLAAHGLYTVGAFLTPRLARVLRPVRRRPGRSLAAVVTLALIAVVLLSNGLYTRSNTARTAIAYQNEHLLSDEEEAAFQWLAEESGGAGKVMNDSNDGSTYMWALEGLRPVFGHIMPLGSAPGATQRRLLAHFNCLDSDPEVREAIRDLDIRYVYIGPGFVRDEMERVPGLRNLFGLQSLVPLYNQDGVHIYRVELTPETTAQAQVCTLGEDDDQE